MRFDEALEYLTPLYQLGTRTETWREIVSGHINKTYYVKYTDGNEYIIQNVNTFVFKDPLKIMKNIRTVSERFADGNADGGCAITHYIDNKEGRNYAVLSDGSFWRVSLYVPNSVGYEHVENGEVLFSTGYGFGSFIARLSDIDPAEMEITIPDFHNTKKRLDDFFLKVEEDPLGLAGGVEKEIGFFRENRTRAEKLCRMAEAGSVPLRVVHNDTKVNNILLDKDTSRPLCVIDLDTIMPGLAAYDFGDAIRFAANTACEDETDLSRVALNPEYFERFASGFMKAAAPVLTEAEAETLALGAPTITVELASRFLLDYLDGDRYFSVHRPHHNLDRARCQIALAADMFRRLPQMEELVMKLYRSCRGGETETTK